MNFFKRNRKISFQEEDLVLCRIALVTDYKILEYGTRNTSWDYHDQTTWRVLPEVRILIREGAEYYYEPHEHFELFGKRRYKKGHGFLKEGDRFVVETNNIPIQYCTEITLTEKELKTKKITLKRIKELENLLNSKK